jgi:hypothetical protein
LILKINEKDLTAGFFNLDLQQELPPTAYYQVYFRYLLQPFIQYFI